MQNPSITANLEIAVTAQPQIIVPSLVSEGNPEKLLVSGNNEVFILNPDGSNHTQINASMIREDSSPSFSSDGSEIVYGGSDGDIYLTDISQSYIVNLTHSPSRDRNPFFSPDGKRIAFESDRGRAFGLYVMNSDGTNVSSVIDSPDDIYIGGWNPNGNKIVYTQIQLPVTMVEGVPAIPTYLIKIIDLNSGVIQTLVADGQGEIFHPTFPSYSPDGAEIIFQGSIQGQFNIFTIDPEGNNLKRITQNDSYFFTNPYWSPNGKQIAVYVSPLEKGNGNSFLGIIDMEGDLLKKFKDINGYVTSWIKQK